AAAPPAQREHANTGLRQVTPGVRGVGLLRSFDWKHAVAELLLIAVGVLAALAVNNWNDERRQRRLESTMLGQLRVELSSDLAVPGQIDGEFRRGGRGMVALLADLDRGGPEADSGDVRFGAVLRIWQLPLHRSVYETLKVKGLDLVSRDALRLRIVDLYENVY